MFVQLGPGLGDPVEAQAVEAISQGILTTLTVSLPSGASTTMALYVQAGITRTRDIYQDVKAELIQAYIDDTTPATWTGFLPILDNEFLYLSIKGNGNPVIRAEGRMLGKETVILPGVKLEQLLLPRI